MPVTDKFFDKIPTNIVEGAKEKTTTELKAETDAVAEQARLAKEKTDAEQAEAARLAKEAGGEEEEEEENEEDDLTTEELEALLEKPETELTDAEKTQIQTAKEKLEKADANKTNIELLLEADGYELDDAFVQELMTDGDSIETLTKYTDRVAKMKADTLFNSNPIVSSLHNHLNNGGTFASFKEANTEDPFVKLKIDEDTDASILENIIKHDLSEKGLDTEDIDSIIKSAKKDNKLFEKSSRSQESIKGRDTQRRNEVIQKEQSRIESEKLASKQEVAKINDMFKNNKFGEFSLPSSDLPTFQKAFVTPIDSNNNTILDKKWEGLTTEQRTILDYIVYKDFNIKGLLTNKSKIENLKFRKKENDGRNPKFQQKSVSLGHKITPELRSKLKGIDFKA